jgi:hypothetical protein
MENSKEWPAFLWLHRATLPVLEEKCVMTAASIIPNSTKTIQYNTLQFLPVAVMRACRICIPWSLAVPGHLPEFWQYLWCDMGDGHLYRHLFCFLCLFHFSTDFSRRSRPRVPQPLPDTPCLAATGHRAVRQLCCLQRRARRLCSRRFPLDTRCRPLL